METENNDVTISCLQHAITDAQETIRAYDSKAEILAILLTVALGITNFTLLQNNPDAWSRYLLAVSWIVGLLTLASLGMVLRPRKNPFKGILLGAYRPAGTYFFCNVLACPENTVEGLAKRAKDTDWVSELTYESVKLSLIREAKHGWFSRALWFAALTLLLVTLAVLKVVA